ncbi:MAG: NAD-dependent epimerase/dehydratase family protein [candidate division KSB1 bacterium]|nr:NAD-dependent epimerase/dehydratase family protein [candidate division KSB1 bacterium]MDZ7275842.1 NAD-dependent epimerase/dehydratase family protein [candidate division KSB1 bacterium]MDZ7287592.1 NAD-dependent epimerase/dehydratase family protein [candidate division KSB1 bacterium]MDZ7306504.1 NAD-dependent epimerase/dehydratase family protein [candidate division KSB1 bacterium]MDZ7350570.1 NAD-dependent epimerase/dehydratase family protein [candidate division KSB1 bacterium]
MRYFLTGATGFIGGRLARALRAAGHEVVALVRNPGRAASLAEAGVTLASGDLTDKAGMRPAMAGADRVFHLAAWYKIGAKDSTMAERINVAGTRHVLELVRELGIPKAVYTSTLAVFSDTHGRMVDEHYRHDGPHLSEYDRTKWLAHHQVAVPMAAAGLPLVIVQPGLVYGPGDTSAVAQTFKQYLQRRLPLLPERTAFCWAHVDDVVRGHLLAMEKGRPGESYILAGPPHTLIEAFAIAERITGIKAPRLRAKPGLLRFLAALSAFFGTFLTIPETYAAETLRVSAGVTYLGDNAKAKRELGYMVRPLEQGLRETLLQMMTDLGLPTTITITPRTS